MRPEAIKYLIECYLKEKQSSSNYDVVDGVSYTSRKFERGDLSGETHGAQDDRCNELLYLHSETSAPYEQYHAPLGPGQEEILRSFGRQLSNMSDEFDDLLLSPRSTVKEKLTFQFEKKCLFVLPSSEIVEVPVIRTGNKEEECSVKWRTRDKTALAGVHYLEAEEEVAFGKGETKKYIQIVLLENKHNEDSCFTVEILGCEEDSANTITICMTDHDNLYPDEMNVIENIVEARRFSFMNVASCLMRKVTVNTFKTALMYLSSNANSMPQEFAYAFELLRVALPSFRRETLIKIVCDFFRHAPETDELQKYVEESENDQEDEG